MLALGSVDTLDSAKAHLSYTRVQVKSYLWGVQGVHATYRRGEHLPPSGNSNSNLAAFSAHPIVEGYLGRVPASPIGKVVSAPLPPCRASLAAPQRAPSLAAASPIGRRRARALSLTVILKGTSHEHP